MKSIVYRIALLLVFMLTCSHVHAQTRMTEVKGESVTTTMQSAAAANGNGTVLTVDGKATAILTVNCSSCSGGTQINFEVQNDGSNFFAIYAFRIDGSTVATSTTTSGLTNWFVPVSGFKQLRARISAYSAGTVTVTGTAVPMPFTPPKFPMVDSNGAAVTNNDIVTVKTDQTTPGTTDLVHATEVASTSTTTTMQNAVTANGNGTVLAVDGMSSAILTVNCSSCSGGTTVNFEAQNDGTNFSAVTATKVGTGTIATTTTTSGLTYWQVPVAGFKQLRARVSAYSAGTITVVGTTVPVDYNSRVVNANLMCAGTDILTGVGTGTTCAIRVTPSGSTPSLQNALSTTVATVTGSAGMLTEYYCANPNTTKAYVQIFDISGTVTLGTSTPKWSIAIPPNDGAANLAGLTLTFANAIKVAATTTATGSTAPSTALDCNFGYR